LPAGQREQDILQLARLCLRSHALGSNCAQLGLRLRLFKR